ncbi:MAG: cytochrome c biogenesis protein CcdA, partial [Thermoproteota archaeon]|nr:cytochrome c biogenesis protein CcdA [Thermoproteota archaeon]
MVETSVLISALAGAGSFFSPCILPIIPAFVSYLSGTALNEIQGQNQSLKGASVAMKRSTRLNIFLNTVYFVLGFSLVFAIMGVVLNSFLANVGIGF